jgi:thymidylate kinase
MRTPFIVVEGLDGTGKSTLAARLAARLGATLLRTPTSEFSAVRLVVDATFAASPVAAQLFYSATVVYASDRARSLLARGTPVVIDRYWLSTVVYAACRDAHIDLSSVELVLLRPDLTVFVEADENVRRDRLAARGMTEADRDSVAQRDSLRERYLARLSGCALSGAVLRLDSTRATPDELVERVLAVVA